MKKLAASTLAIASIMGLTACLSQPKGISTAYAQTSSAYQVGTIPRYTGTVLDLNEPIVLRLRPFPLSPLRKRTVSKFANSSGPEKFEQEDIMTGSVQRTTAGQEGVTVFKIDRVDSSGSSGRKVEDNSMSISMRTTDRGAIIGLDSDTPGLDKEQLDAFAKVFTSFMPQFPERGVRIGDDIYAVNRDISLGGSNNEIGVSMSGIVSGVTWHKGRHAIIINTKARVSFQGFSLKMVGYSLLDSHTGTYLFSDIYGEGAINEEDGKSFTMSMRETTETSLAQMETSTESKNLDAPIPKIEKRLKELQTLLQKGLITEKEAQEKRSAILNDL